jgi:hypothetical protein
MTLTSRDVGNTLKKNLPVKFFSVAGMLVSKAGSSDVKRVKTIIRGRWREAMIQEWND